MIYIDIYITYRYISCHWYIFFWSFLLISHFSTLLSWLFFSSLSTNRSRLIWKTQPSTTSRGLSSSRWSGTWESLALRCWACPAPTSPLTTGACRQGRATAPPTALWPYWPWTLTARKRWLLSFRLSHRTCLFVSFFSFHFTYSCVIYLLWPLALDGRCHWWHY